MALGVKRGIEAEKTVDALLYSDVGEGAADVFVLKNADGVMDVYVLELITLDEIELEKLVLVDVVAEVLLENKDVLL